ncbi:MAG: hypothetical protein D6806_05745 [Deltaproteobacteria bacterium]|nr:MAG: hypothetical protein D6806_05745 [Deltaproteobacteria bacterium]
MKGMTVNGPGRQLQDKVLFDDVERAKFAMSVMDYNQEFIRFTDEKANSLLLVNSIILAVSASAAQASVLGLVTAACAACAVILCLAVVVTRSAGTLGSDSARVVFFADIIKRRTRADYRQDFLRIEPRQLADGLLDQIYDLAHLVDRKLGMYRIAQLATYLSATAWIVSLVNELAATRV